MTKESASSSAPKPYWSWLFKRLGFEWENVDWAGYVCAWVGYFNWFGWSVRLESWSRKTTWQEAQQ
jgi:hypothetical protein